MSCQNPHHNHDSHPTPTQFVVTLLIFSFIGWGLVLGVLRVAHKQVERAVHSVARDVNQAEKSKRISGKNSAIAASAE